MQRAMATEAEASRNSRAKVTFSVPNPVGTPTILTLPKFSPFTTEINSFQYTFVNLDSGDVFANSFLTIVFKLLIHYSYKKEIYL
jgi:hypothetical protein